MTEQQEQEIMDLRALSLTPKQIARKLGIKVSLVSATIQKHSQQATLDRLAKGELDPVYQCFASEGLIQLLVKKTPENAIKNLLAKIIPAKNDEDIARGLGLVVIAREARYNQITFCSYLLDVWCLGVKDAAPPRTVDKIKFKELIQELFKLFPGEPQEIPLEVAQGMIFSAYEYAQSLGFQPHKDFEKSRSHIGQWDGAIRFECGRNGKPFYISGPYDDQEKIIETLKKSKGEGNFDFMSGSAGSLDIF